MTSHCRWWVGPGNGKWNFHFDWDRINRNSCVMITASECGPGDTNTGGQVNNDRFLGEAVYTVHNIAPYHGGVDFRVTIDWPEPLNTYIDITVFDDPNDVWTSGYTK
jgi:hypothetical protein